MGNTFQCPEEISTVTIIAGGDQNGSSHEISHRDEMDDDFCLWPLFEEPGSEEKNGIFHVDARILRQASPVLEQMISFPSVEFKQTNTIHLPQFSPEAVKLCLCWASHMVAFGEDGPATGLIDEASIVLLAPVAMHLECAAILDMMVAKIKTNPNLKKVCAIESAGAKIKWPAPVIATLAKEITGMPIKGLTVTQTPCNNHIACGNTVFCDVCHTGIPCDRELSCGNPFYVTLFKPGMKEKKVEEMIQRLSPTTSVLVLQKWATMNCSARVCSESVHTQQLPP